MKCPFRKETNYSHLVKAYNAYQVVGDKDRYERKPCKPDEADKIVEDFAECLNTQCPYFLKADNCRKVMEN